MQLKLPNSVTHLYCQHNIICTSPQKLLPGWVWAHGWGLGTGRVSREWRQSPDERPVCTDWHWALGWSPAFPPARSSPCTSPANPESRQTYSLSHSQYVCAILNHFVIRTTVIRMLYQQHLTPLNTHYHIFGLFANQVTPNLDGGLFLFSYFIEHCWI